LEAYPAPSAGRLLCPTAHGSRHAAVDTARAVRILFTMAVETIGQARDQGWRVRVRCSWTPPHRMEGRGRECGYDAELDLPTLVWTRGRAFPLGRLESRLRCPRCGSREVTVLFIPPTTKQIATGGKR